MMTLKVVDDAIEAIDDEGETRAALYDCWCIYRIISEVTPAD